MVTIKKYSSTSNFMECEIIHYPNRNSLAIQGHPELDTYHHEYKGDNPRLNFQTLKL
jgi:hypothetical protein